MSFTCRLLSKSKQWHGSQIILQREHVVPVRFFAKQAVSKQTIPKAFLAIAQKGDEMLKVKFREYWRKFETAMEILGKDRIIIDPIDPAAVSHYARVMKTIREKTGFLSSSQRMEYAIEQRTRGIPDTRTYLLALKDLRIQKGLPDVDGAEAMMMDALEKVEKEIKKPLLRNDKEGVALLMAEFDKINKKLGIRREDMPKYEEEVELAVAKKQLEDLREDAIKEMETYSKRPEFSHEKLPDIRTLDHRNFL